LFGVGMSRLMLVDDETNILSSLRRAINAMPEGTFDGPVTVETFVNPQQALERASEQAFDLVISDYRMPEMDGVAFLEALRAIQPDIARMILSGYADLKSLIAAINRAEIYRFVAKPWDEHDLALAIRQALSHRALMMENAHLADLVRVQRGKLSRSELMMKRMEEQYPGITQVKRQPDGSIDLDMGLDEEL
jgi:two-component system, probable response regulator PhcQ